MVALGEQAAASNSNDIADRAETLLVEPAVVQDLARGCDRPGRV